MPKSRATKVLIACRDSLFQLGNLFAVQRFLSSPVGTALLGQHDSLALAFADQCALELRKAPMTDSIKLAIGESSPVNASPSLTNSIRTPRCVSP